MDVVSLVNKVLDMKYRSYQVGIWGLDNNDNEFIKFLCGMTGIDFRFKEYLDATHGTYKYQGAVDGQTKKDVYCKTTELLIAPDGYIFRCHSDLYAHRNPIGHILDEDIPSFDFRTCDNYGRCNPCDVKLKTNRHQEFGHCSVEIKDAD